MTHSATSDRFGPSSRRKGRPVAAGAKSQDAFSELSRAFNATPGDVFQSLSQDEKADIARQANAFVNEQQVRDQEAQLREFFSDFNTDTQAFQEAYQRNEATAEQARAVVNSAKKVQRSFVTMNARMKKTRSTSPKMTQAIQQLQSTATSISTKMKKAVKAILDLAGQAFIDLVAPSEQTGTVTKDVTIGMLSKEHQFSNAGNKEFKDMLEAEAAERRRVEAQIKAAEAYVREQHGLPSLRSMHDGPLHTESPGAA